MDPKIAEGLTALDKAFGIDQNNEAGEEAASRLGQALVDCLGLKVSRFKGKGGLTLYETSFGEKTLSGVARSVITILKKFTEEEGE